MGTLSADGYYQLDDRRLPGSLANLDHILLGPAGAFVVDAKNWTGQLAVDGRSLRQDGRRRDDHVERVRVQAVDVATIIEEFMGPRRVEVRPVICFVGEARLPAPTPIDRVHLCHCDELAPFIRGLEPKLDQPTVDEVMGRLLSLLPPRLASVAPAVTTTERLPKHGGARPAEMVLYLERWNKYGHRRLYVKTSDGSAAGHLDVGSGEVHPSSDQWRPVLAQLLPHYVTATATGGQAEALTTEARGVLRRFVDAVRRRPDQKPREAILVGFHWRNYGKDRLYVNRIGHAGTKEELGWYDLASETAKPADPRFASLIEYCGDQFRSVAAR